MLLRRLFFLFPTPQHAERVCRELIAAQVDEQHIHAVAREDIDISMLPATTPRQRDDSAARIEHVSWNTNLAVFAVAALCLLMSPFVGSVWLAIVALAVMLVTFLGGAWFAIKVPDVHLSEFREAMAHGEVVLMVDVPAKRTAEIEDLVHRHHPEASVGGTGWSIDGLEI